MSRLTFEFVGDVTCTYPYICVYLEKDSSPFMDIGINEDKELIFSFYASFKDINLTLDEWKKIQLKGELFLPRTLRNEEEFQELEAELRGRDKRDK